MADIFFISDTHFGHQGSCNFLRTDGVTKMRPFDTSEEMDEILVENWNKVVKPFDKVYHLGDVSMKRKDIATVGRCNGKKVLVRGNHDIFNLTDYTPYFYDIRGVHVMPARDMILSHIPLHGESIDRFRINIHGHTHEKSVGSLQHCCVCVEQINYTPISLEELNSRINKGEY